MTSYLINNNSLDRKDPSFNQALTIAYKNKYRPLCLCKTPGTPMYIARNGEGYVLKRMPDSGSDHNENCESFEIPSELSGRGALENRAISVDQDTGITNLKLDFSLSKISVNRTMGEGDGQEPKTIEAEPTKLAIRSLLHYLYEEAGLNKWSPRMEGKRNWYVIRKYLLLGSLNKTARNNSLAEVLLIPEAFKVENKDAICSRRRQFLKKFKKKGGKQPMGLLIGELKAIEPARFDYKLVVKNMPDTPLYMGEYVYKNIYKQFSMEMAFFEQNEFVHLLAICTFSLSASGSPQIDTLSLMLLDRNWLPFENIEEYEMLERLVTDKRHFIKGLRYNLHQTDVIASALVTDIKDDPTALYLIPIGAEEQYYEDLDAVLVKSELNSCVWDLNEEKVLELPQRKYEQPETNQSTADQYMSDQFVPEQTDETESITAPDGSVANITPVIKNGKAVSDLHS